MLIAMHYSGHTLNGSSARLLGQVWASPTLVSSIAYIYGVHCSVCEWLRSACNNGKWQTPNKCERRWPWKMMLMNDSQEGQPGRTARKDSQERQPGKTARKDSEHMHIYYTRNGSCVGTDRQLEHNYLLYVRIQGLTIVYKQAEHRRWQRFCSMTDISYFSKMPQVRYMHDKPGCVLM